MKCYNCQQEIKGKIKKRHVATCHPAVTYYTVKLCEKCYKK